ATVDLMIPFSYTLGLADEGGGLLDSLGGMGGPADVGLLSRHRDAVNLGHWFPIWVPAGNSVEPEPAGFGDIGNFPAALIRLDLTVPKGWTVVDGGVRVASKQVSDGHVRVVSEGYGMNDLVVSLLRDYRSSSVELTGDLAGVTVTAYAPADAADQLAGVLDETKAALVTLSDVLVAYPWREFDIVSAPLGSGVGGMEWPGATWIEPTLLAGGIPGLGDLGSLGGLDGLEGLDGLGGLLGGETGAVLDTLRPWTIAHEVGHEWWHILVGNDSVLDPVVDEPLAQYSACLVLRAGDTPDADAACRAQIDSAYEQMRMLGDQDAPADRSTDDFASSGQYAGVIYGKAAAFYLALEDAYGADQVAAALGQVARERAFTMTSAEQLRDALGSALGERQQFDRLWRRWMERARGDGDLGVSGGSGAGALGGLEDLLGGRSPEELQRLIDQLLGAADPGAA
ncbi:MAG: M1 family aminopeptidase, partial [Nocardioides sp.]